VKNVSLQDEEIVGNQAVSATTTTTTVTNANIFLTSTVQKIVCHFSLI